MAGTHGIICYLSLLAFFLQTVVAPPPKGFFVNDPEPSTSTQLSLEEENDRNSIWDEDEDVFDLDGDSWLKQPPAAPLSTWPTSNKLPKPSEFDDGNEDNLIDDDDEDSDEEHDNDGDPSEFVLIPEVKADDDKRDMKVRHTGRYPENDAVNDDASDDNDADESPESNDGEMIVAFPESNPSKDEDFNDDNDGNVDDDLFGDQDEDDSKKLFEDRVFLF